MFLNRQIKQTIFLESCIKIQTEKLILLCRFYRCGISVSCFGRFIFIAATGINENLNKPWWQKLEISPFYNAFYLTIRSKIHI